MEDKKICELIHKVDGHIPHFSDTHLDGRVCDCRRMIYFKEECGCPGNPWQLRSKPNENFTN